MGSENLQILRHLAQMGESSVAQLMVVVHESRPAINIRLVTMESLGWLQKSVDHHNTRLWRVRPEAYDKLAAVGIQAIPPAPKQSRIRQSHKPLATDQVAQPRRFNIYEAPIWCGMELAAPPRAGSLDFLSCPSRGAI